MVLQVETFPTLWPISERDKKTFEDHRKMMEEQIGKEAYDKLNREIEKEFLIGHGVDDAD